MNAAQSHNDYELEDLLKKIWNPEEDCLLTQTNGELLIRTKDLYIHYRQAIDWGWTSLLEWLSTNLLIYGVMRGHVLVTGEFGYHYCLGQTRQEVENIESVDLIRLAGAIKESEILLRTHWQELGFQ